VVEVVFDILCHFLLALLFYLKLGQVQVNSETSDGCEFLFEYCVYLGLEVLNAVRISQKAKVDQTVYVKLLIRV